MKIIQTLFATIAFNITITCALSSSRQSSEGYNNDEETPHIRNLDQFDYGLLPREFQEQDVDDLGVVMRRTDREYCKMCLLLVAAKKRDMPNMVTDTNSKICHQCKATCGRCENVQRQVFNPVTRDSSKVCDTCTVDLLIQRILENNSGTVSASLNPRRNLCARCRNLKRDSINLVTRAAIRMCDTCAADVLEQKRIENNHTGASIAGASAQNARPGGIGHRVKTCKARSCKALAKFQGPPSCYQHWDRVWCSKRRQGCLAIALPDDEVCYLHSLSPKAQENRLRRSTRRNTASGALQE